jgi:hypothetical protein
MPLRFDTCDGIIPVEDDFEDESVQTLPVEVPPDLSPAILRLLADVQSATTERIAADFEAFADGRPVLMGTDAAAARIRSMAWLRPRKRRAA